MLSVLGRRPAGGRGSGRVARVTVAGASSPRASVSRRPSGTSPPVIASSRNQKREATVGPASDRRARVRSTRGAPSRFWRSWAASPIRRSPAGSPSSRRMRGASHGSGAGSAGHTPSFSPPAIIRSTCASRASIRPRIDRRGCPPCGGRTARPSIRLASRPGHSAGVDGAQPGRVGLDLVPPVGERATGRPGPQPVARQRLGGGAEAGEEGSATSPSGRRRAAPAPRARSPTSPPPSRPPAAAAWRSRPGRRAAARRASADRATAHAGQPLDPLPPAMASGCFSTASSPSGANRSAAARASSDRNAPGGVAASGVPAESSTSTPQRFRCAATRRASARSG